MLDTKTKITMQQRGVEARLVSPATAWIENHAKNQFGDKFNPNVVAAFSSLLFVIAIAGQSIGGFLGIFFFLTGAIAWKMSDEILFRTFEHPNAFWRDVRATAWAIVLFQSALIALSASTIVLVALCVGTIMISQYTRERSHVFENFGFGLAWPFAMIISAAGFPLAAGMTILAFVLWSLSVITMTSVDAATEQFAERFLDPRRV